MCSWPMCQRCWGPVSSLGSLLPLAHFILLLLLPCGTHRHTEPRLSHSCLAVLHSSNNANYISNGNRWGLVSSSHSLERFTNIHQRATDRPELPPSKPDFSGSWGPGSLITPAVPHCCPAHRLHREDSSSRITGAIFSYACPQTQPKLHRRVISIIQWLN